MNVAAASGDEAARLLRDWWVESDARFDPQAYVLRPDVVLKLAAEIVAEPTAYRRTRRAALSTLAELRQAHAAGKFPLSKIEIRWLDKLSHQADELPEDEAALTAAMLPTLDPGKIRVAEYGL
jgi:methanol--5-hydroxybenzimidazolylcobamide Co-methyltransferase